MLILSVLVSERKQWNLFWISRCSVVGSGDVSVFTKTIKFSHIMSSFGLCDNCYINNNNVVIIHTVLLIA